LYFGQRGGLLRFNFSQEVIMVHFGAVKKFLEEQRFVKVTDFAAHKKRSKRTKKKKKKRK
jgi:hypothetical protein